MDDIRWIDERETSRLTGRAIQTLRNDRAKGQGLPYYLIGRSVRYKMQEVLTFMQENRVKTEPIKTKRQK